MSAIIDAGFVCLSFRFCINDKKKRSHVVIQWSIIFFLVDVAPICKPMVICQGHSSTRFFILIPNEVPSETSLYKTTEGPKRVND